MAIAIPITGQGGTPGSIQVMRTGRVTLRSTRAVPTTSRAGGLESLCDVMPLRVVLKQGCSEPSTSCLSPCKPGPDFEADLVSGFFCRHPGLPVSRQTRAGLMKSQPSAGVLKPPWYQFLSSLPTGCPCLQANQGRPDKQATQRRLFEADLVSVPFVTIHGLPLSPGKPGPA